MKMHHSPDVVLSDEIVEELNKASKGFAAPRFNITKEEYTGNTHALIDTKQIHKQQRESKPKTALEQALFTVKRAQTAPTQRQSQAYTGEPTSQQQR